MMKFVSIVLMAFAIQSSMAAVSSGCPGKKEGEEFNEGRYWYECRSGKNVPKGCLDSNDGRVPVGGTYMTKDFVMQCVQNGDFLTSLYKSCAFQGTEHQLGSQWSDGTTTYTCVKNGDAMAVHKLGCVDDGRQLAFKDRVAKGDFIYQCDQKADGTPTMNKVGCVVSGQKYNIGQAFTGEKFWYTCTDHGAEIVGCMYNGQKLQANDHFTMGDMMYSCKVTSKSADLEPYACLQNEGGASIERKVGCFWNEGDYEYTCKVDGSKVSKVKSQCLYHGAEGVVKVQPGSTSTAGSIKITCIDAGNGNLQLQTA
jgi:hypothetical protein